MFGLAGLAAALYISTLSATLNDAKHPNPWLPTPWYWLVLAAFAIGIVGGTSLELLAARKKRSSTPAVTEPTTDTPQPVGGQQQRARAYISGPTRRFGRVMTSRMISGPYIYHVKWASNLKTIGFLAAGNQGGFDVYNVDEVYLASAPSLMAAANMLDMTAD